MKYRIMLFRILELFFGLEQEERCEPDMEIRRSMNSDELNVRRGRVERIDIEKIEIEKRIGKLEG